MTNLQQLSTDLLTLPQLYQLANLDFYEEICPVKQTSIICTIGPATQPVEILEKLLIAGMNIARLNFSHGTHEYHLQTIENIRLACSNVTKKMGVQCVCAIALDTKGPEIRTGKMEGGVKKVELIKLNEITVTTNEAYAEKCSANIIYIDYQSITRIVKPGNRIFIDDGQISLLIKKIGKTDITCIVENSGFLSEHKGVNLPGVVIDLPMVSEKDRDDILFGVKHRVDIIFASFTRSEETISEIKEILGSDGNNIMIIPKIENHEGVHNLDEIIMASDGIMLARGDLGINIPMQKVNIVQKAATARCITAGKRIICATNMMESMTKNPIPTRAEICDVANAVLDGCDCVMLSGETAAGAYPVKTVNIMSKIVREAELITLYNKLHYDILDLIQPPISQLNTIAIATVVAADRANSPVIIITSTSGRTAMAVSRFRPRCPVIVITRNPGTARKIQIFRSLIPLVYQNEGLSDWMNDIDVRILHGLVYGQCLGIVKPHDKIITVTGVSPGTGKTNTMRVLQIAENIFDTVITPGQM